MINNVAGATVEESGNLRSSLEVLKSFSDKYLHLLRSSARYCSLLKGQAPSRNLVRLGVKHPEFGASRWAWRTVGKPHFFLRSRFFSGQAQDTAGKGKYTLIKDEEDFQIGIFDKPLPCFGCGIGWFSFLVGFLCPLMWYYAMFLYFGNHYRKDPRESWPCSLCNCSKFS